MSHKDLVKVNRVEVIDAEGRSYVKYGVTGVHLDIQDEGRTLKIFLTERKEEGHKE